MITHNRKVGKYSILRLIAQGGMGKIYKAKHPTLNREIILKKLTLAGNRAVTERFKREAELMIDFREDRIVQVYDHFREGQSYYIAMEYVDGISLAALIDRERYLPNEIALLLFLEICRALKYAHDKGVIHRDIKPENILISKEGAVKLTDFGIATSKSFQSDNLTRNLVLGTPAYMSPEQINNTSSVDKRADIYSLGVLLYKMVTGRCPFPGNMNPETVSRISKGIYRLPRKVNPGISQFVQRIIVRSMQAKPSRRYSDLVEIINRIEAYLKYSSTPVIQEEIKTYISTKKNAGKTHITERKLIKTRHTGEAGVIAVSVALLCILFSLFLYSFNSGFHHELFGIDRYGAVVIQLSGKGEIETGRSVYIEKKEDENLTMSKNISLYSVENDLAKERYLLQSKRIYLKTGEYRLRTSVNGELLYHDFLIHSRREQRRKSDFWGEERVCVLHTQVSSQLMDLKYRVFNSVNGEEITEDSILLLVKNNKKLKIFDAHNKQVADLRSGEDHILFVTHDGYKSREIKIQSSTHQSSVHLSVALDPVPGTLAVSSNQRGVRLKLNNADHYIHAEKKEMIDIGLLDESVKELVLAPGSYFVSAIWNGKRELSEITIDSQSVKTMQIVCNNNGKLTMSLD